MNASVLLFDLDETLAPDEAANVAVFRSEMTPVIGAGERDGQRLLAEFTDIIERLWRRGPAADYCLRLGISAWEGLWGPFGASEQPMLSLLHAWVPSYRATVWQSLVSLLGLQPATTLCDELEERFLRARRAAQRAYPWSASVLDELAGRYRLGVVTNGAPDLQRLKLEGTGLAPRFAVVVVSGDVGVGKPERGIFEHALRQTGVGPDEAVMIGDSWERDMLGAIGMGMRGMWVNPANVPLPGDAPSLIRALRDLRDLPAALADGRDKPAGQGR